MMYVSRAVPTPVLPCDLTHVSRRNKPQLPSRRLSSRTISRNVPFTNITGMQSLLNCRACMTLFERVAIPYRVIPLLAGPKARSYDRQQSTGCIQIISYHSNSLLCDTYLSLVCCLPSLSEAVRSEHLTLQFSTQTRNLSPKTQQSHPFTLTMKTLSST